MGPREEAFEGRSAARLAQVEERAPLAGGHLGQECGDLLEARGVDAQDSAP